MDKTDAINNDYGRTVVSKEPKPPTKQDVANSIAVCLMRLGKNDWHGVRFALRHASEMFEAWMSSRLEKVADTKRKQSQPATAAGRFAKETR